MVIALLITSVITIFLIMGCAVYIKHLQDELQLQKVLLKDLLEYKQESAVVLAQHIEILKYLIDQDPILGKIRIPYTGPIGEA